MSSQESNAVVPGDIIAVEEEYSDGDNVYIDSSLGVLRASVLGRLKIDQVNKVANVLPARKLKAPRKGAIVLGIVEQVRENLAFVGIYGEVSLDTRSRWFTEYSDVLSGVITPENLGVDKVDDMLMYLRPNDVVIARVVSTISPYLLSLRGPQLGVIYSVCSRCGSLLSLEGGSLKCPVCGNVESRKLSTLASSRLIRPDVRRLLVRRFE